VNGSLRDTSYRSDTVTTIESNKFHNVAANGACEQETFDGQRMLIHHVAPSNGSHSY